MCTDVPIKFSAELLLSLPFGCSLFVVTTANYPICSFDFATGFTPDILSNDTIPFYLGLGLALIVNLSVVISAEYSLQNYYLQIKNVKDSLDSGRSQSLLMLL